MSQLVTIHNNYNDYNTNPSNHFFMHSSENPTQILVTPLLNVKNYHSWIRAMKLAMQSKNKIQFIGGSFSQPSIDDNLCGPWLRCNTMILSWIQHSVQESIVKLILWMNYVAEFWKDLRERFSQGDIFRVHPSNIELESKILSINTQQTNQYKSTNGNPTFSSFRGKGNSSFRGRSGRFNGAGRGQGNRFCTFSERTKRTIETCFLKHEYSPRYQSSRPSKMANDTTGFPLDNDDTTFLSNTPTDPLSFEEPQHTEQTFTKKYTMAYAPWACSKNPVLHIIDNVVTRRDNMKIVKVNDKKERATKNNLSFGEDNNDISVCQSNIVKVIFSLEVIPHIFGV
ncbi:hypothetical protein Lal_00042142 [Lupinus albus]|nr:hypothetical protein Lal_00042142 [Lupinus albus]